MQAQALAKGARSKTLIIGGDSRIEPCPVREESSEVALEWRYSLPETDRVEDDLTNGGWFRSSKARAIAPTLALVIGGESRIEPCPMRDESSEVALDGRYSLPESDGVEDDRTNGGWFRSSKARAIAPSRLIP
jgi:hypothetical protein